jgi:predicted dienelactone hydrolase
MVIAANHHGNTGLEAYSPEGFVCWWERATDLSFLLGHFAADHPFGPLVGQAPVTAVGYSLGAHAALALMGGVTSMPQFQDFSRDHPAMAQGPREFPDLAERVEGLFETSPAFRESWARHGQSFRNARVSAAILLAPPPPVRAFTPASLAAIAQPVNILVGSQDREADANVCATWLCKQNPAFRLHLMEGVGHYGFLGPLTPQGAGLLASLIGNATTQDRARVHEAIAEVLLDCVYA